MIVDTNVAAQRRLLPGGRLAGPMPWVLAIMIFLTVLAAAAGLGTARAAQALGETIAGRVTVQIVEPDAERRRVQAAAVVALLARTPGVRDIGRVSDAAVRATLTPWLGDVSPGDVSLGDAALGGEIALPVLIDATLDRADDASVVVLAGRLTRVAPTARIDRHGSWLGPLRDLLTAMIGLSVGLIALTALATAATVVLGARAALDQHRATIDVMHLMGASDRQIARLFERGVALDAMTGCAMGAVAAAGVLILVGARVAAVGSALFSEVTLGWPQLFLIALLPAAGVALAVVTARVTVLNALARIL